MRSKSNLNILCAILIINAILNVPLVESQLTDPGINLSAAPKNLSNSNNQLSINGTVFNDSNSDGIMNDGEKGVAGRIIHMMQNGTELSKTVTDDSHGQYYFYELNPGNYTVYEEPVNGWNQTSPFGGSYNFILANASVQHLDFGYTNGITALAGKFQQSDNVKTSSPPEFNSSSKSVIRTGEKCLECMENYSLNSAGALSINGTRYNYSNSNIYEILSKVPLLTSDTGFVYPTLSRPTIDSAYGYDGARTYYDDAGFRYTGWLARGDKGNYDWEPNNFHIAQDIPAHLGDNVYPITDGEIVYISYGGWGASNVALIIKHKEINEADNGNGKVFTALYGHIKPNPDLDLRSTTGEVNPPVKVCSRYPIAEIGSVAGSVPHLHFEIHPGSTYPYTMGSLPLVPNWPVENLNDGPLTTDGHVDPINFITTHMPLCGPDRFGYTFTDNTLTEIKFINDVNSCAPLFDWIEISDDGTEILPNSDDQYENGISLGPNFFFNYYGTDYSQVAISNNGVLFSGAGSGRFTNEPIKRSSSIHGFIGPFWDDIVTWGSAGSIYYKTIPATEHEPRKFVVEWKDNQHYSSSPEGITFELILYEGSNNIKFQYLDTTFGTQALDFGGSATVGIESPDGSDGLQYSYDKQVIKPGLAILFRYPQTEGINLALSKQAPPSKDRGSSMTYTMNYYNSGNNPALNVVLKDILPAEVEYLSCSDGGSYDPSTRAVTWNIGKVEAHSSGQRRVIFNIPQSVPIGTIIRNAASISTAPDIEVQYTDNVAQAETRVTGSNLPPNVAVEPNLGGTTPSVYWGTPITFSYRNPTATAVDIRIHLNDGGQDITGSMTRGSAGGIRGDSSDWTYTTTFYPRHGQATVTYETQGAPCQAATTAPDGLHISPSTGLIGLEQHLYNSVPGDGYVPPTGSFPSTGLVPTSLGSSYTLDNGYAGKGAFAPHPSVSSEKYYINMRWPDGITWNADGTKTITDLSTYLKYAHKKVLITSPVTGKGVIASIEESGPAISTGKVAGAPPEVFVALGLYPTGNGQNFGNNYILNYQWADQNAQLGPCGAESFNIYIDPAGYIYDTDTNERIEGASVWLQRPDGTGGWENVPTGQTPPTMQPDENPLMTNSDGQYQWDVLEGYYRVHVEAPGHNPEDSIVVSIPPPVTDLHVGLQRLPNTPPGAPSTPSGQTSGSTGTPYSYSTSATDPDGDMVEYTFDWGDGTPTITTTQVPSGTTASATHSWSAAGTYQVKSKATDSNGATSDWSNPLTVTVNTPPSKPSIPSGPKSGYAWVPYSYSTSAKDPDGDQVKHTFDWGDTTKSTTGYVDSEASATAPHIWTSAGTYPVKAMTTDSKDATSGWSSSLAVTIAANKPPSAPTKLIGLTSGTVGTNYPYLTVATDPDGDQVKYTYDWGDGTSYTTPLVKSGTTASITHRWSAAGTYLVRTITTDSKGAPSGWSNVLTVKITNKLLGSSAEQSSNRAPRPARPARPARPNRN